MDILWQIFHILTEPVLYTFVSINRQNNEARAHMWLHYSVDLWIRAYTKLVLLKKENLPQNIVHIRIIFTVWLVTDKDDHLPVYRFGL